MLHALGEKDLRPFPGVQYRRQAVVREHVGADFGEDVVRRQKPQDTGCSWKTRNMNLRQDGVDREESIPSLPGCCLAFTAMSLASRP